MTHQIEPVEFIKPDFAYIYAKVARHLAEKTADLLAKLRA